MLSATILAATLALGSGIQQEYKDAPFQGWAQNEERGSTRLIYFSKTTDKPWNYSPGQVAIEYGKPVWKKEYAEGFDDLTRGKRWRMGQNYWSNLDTRFPVHLGRTVVQAGIYYLALERSQGNEWSLVLLDPDSTSEINIDAWHLNRKDSPEGVKVAMRWKRVEQVTQELQIQFQLDETDQRKATLEIRFGDHLLSTPVRAEFAGNQVEASAN